MAAPLAETTLEDFRRLQDVNQVGVFLGTRTVAPVMSAQGDGSVINLSSIAGLIGSPYLTAYAAGKWAVRGMTKVAAKELASAGVRVNSLHPGQIEVDSADVVSQLFVLVNLIGEYMISMPKRVSELYDGLPQSAREQIDRRDAGT